MNIFKSKKLTAAIVTFVTAMTLAGLPLAAKERQGSTVEVTMADGSTVKGELLAVKNDVLLVYDNVADQGKVIGVQHVVLAKVLRKSKLGHGLLSGFVVGLVIIFGSRLRLPNTGKDEQLSNLGFPFIAAIGGGLLGVLACLPVKLPLAGESSEFVQQNLDWLKRYARERDIKKPAAD